MTLELASKLKMTEPSTLSRPKLVDAIVFGQNGTMLRFKPYLNGFRVEIFEISYYYGKNMGMIYNFLKVQERNSIIFVFK
jgi:hypothetical protein